jgi:hypothetical protein
MADTPTNTDFGAWVKQQLAGRNYREAGEEIGLHFTILYDLAKGRRKSRGTVVRFARGIGANVNEALRMAGLEPEYESNAERFLRGVQELGEKYGRPPIPPSFWGGIEGLEKLTPEQVDARLAELEEQWAEDAEAGS